MPTFWWIYWRVHSLIFTITTFACKETMCNIIVICLKTLNIDKHNIYFRQCDDYSNFQTTNGEYWQARSHNKLYTKDIIILLWNKKKLRQKERERDLSQSKNIMWINFQKHKFFKLFYFYQTFLTKREMNEYVV